MVFIVVVVVVIYIYIYILLFVDECMLGFFLSRVYFV
jgi:hypothetical protein